MVAGATGTRALGLRRAPAFVAPVRDRCSPTPRDPAQQTEQPEVAEPVPKLQAKARLEVWQQVEVAAIVAAVMDAAERHDATAQGARD